MRGFVRRAAIAPRSGMRTLSRSARPVVSRMAVGVASGLVLGGLTLSGATAFALVSAEENAPAVNFKALEEDLRKLIASAGSYDDGRYVFLFFLALQKACPRSQMADPIV